MTSSLPHTNCAFVNIRRASRAICHLYDLVLGPTELKATQFTILRTIDEAGEIAHCDLGTDIAASVETLSRRLASARKSGWVRMRVGKNGRHLYRLTPKGKRVLDEALPYWERAQLRLRCTLGEKDWQLLASFTEALTSAAIRAETQRFSNGAAKQTNLRPHKKESLDCLATLKASLRRHVGSVYPRRLQFFSGVAIATHRRNSIRHLSLQLGSSTELFRWIVCNVQATFFG